MLSQKFLSCVLLIGKKWGSPRSWSWDYYTESKDITAQLESKRNLTTLEFVNTDIANMQPCAWRKWKVNTSPEGCEILWDEFHKRLEKWPNQSHLTATLSRGKSRFCRPRAFTFLSERGKCSLVQRIFSISLEWKKVTTHNHFLMENITKVTRYVKISHP